MIASVSLDKLKQAHWYEFVVRFILGGLVTATTALILKHWGPIAGGLFLAFPVIFPASVSLIEAHETEKKRRAGIRCRRRGRKAAAVDAAGAVLGAWALACFALVMRLVTWYSSAWILLAAALTWATVAVALWWTRWKHLPERWLSH